MSRLRAWLATGSSVLALFGCSTVLDLEDAHLDPSIGSLAGGAGGQDAGPSPCAQYCDAIMSGCTDERAQYTDLAACLRICPLFPEGTPGDASGNSLQCRLNYARKASGEPLTYCTWAGPGGDGKCGSNCEGFCSLMTLTCTSATTVEAGDYFDSEQECLRACGELPDVGNYSASDSSLQSGVDHVECRLYHINAAIFADDARTHCPHAMGQRLCVSKAAD